jgi:DNA-binding CsgD family transcriptional regulator/tetratricopeptide (TPR) repeat protein
VDDFRRLVAAVAARPAEEDEHEDRVLLAAAACAQAFGGRGADEVRALMVRSAGGGALAREETAQGAALYLATGVLTWVDCFDEALTLLDTAVEEARERRWHDALGTASYCRGYIRMRDGEIAAALDDFGTAQALRELGWNAYVPVPLSALVECHLARGEPDQAALHAEELRVAATLPVAVLAAYAHRGLGDLAQARGAHAEAAESFRAAGEALAGVTDNPTIMPWRSRAAISLAHVDRVGQARELAEAEVGLARAWGAPRALSEALLLQARLEPPARRESVLREALEVARSGRTGLVGHEIALALAEVLLARGRAADTDEVASLATPVDAYAEAQGLTPLGARAARLLGTLGLVAVSRVSTDGSGLSPAERRVVDLAAAGLTNRQIAGYLFLTVKAVEWHLSASYRKLGISSRRQLAAALGLPPGGDARAQSVVAEVHRRVGPTHPS